MVLFNFSGVDVHSLYVLAGASCNFNDVQVDGENGTTIEDQTDDYGDRFSELVALEDGGVKKSTSMLGATVNVGVEYEMPFYDKLSVGLLSTTRIQGRYTWNEERQVFVLAKGYEVPDTTDVWASDENNRQQMLALFGAEVPEVQPKTDNQFDGEF